MRHLAILGGVLLALTAQAGVLTQSPDPATAFTDRSFSVTYSFAGDGSTYGFGYLLSFDPAVYSGASAENLGGLLTTCTADNNNHTLRIFRTFGTTFPLPSTSTPYCRFTLNVRPNAALGTIAFGYSNTSCATFSGSCGRSGGFAVDVQPLPINPTLSYNPLPGSNVSLNGTTVGSTGSASIVITPSGQQGTGATAVHSCQISGSGAAAFGSPTTSPADGIFDSNDPGSIDLSCVLEPSVRSAMLTCTEATGGVKPTATPRSWPLTCPAGGAGEPPVLQYQPTPGTTAANAPIVTFVGGPGTLRQTSIPVSASGGSGSGPASTTTLSDCQIAPALSPAVFACTPSAGGSLSFVPGQPDPGDIQCSCDSPAVGSADAVLSCVEQAGSGSPLTRVWNLSCGNASPPTLSYQPSPGASPGAAPLVSVAGSAGALLPLTIGVSASGGSGSGDAATARLGSCFVAPDPGAAGVYACTPTLPPLDFLPGQPDPGDIQCTCQSSAGGQFGATLRCTEATPANTGTPQFHYWQLGCNVTADGSLSLSATPTIVGPGGAVRLSWFSSAAGKGGQCISSAGVGTIWSLLGPLASSGERLLAAPTSPGTVGFELTCGGVSAVASVEVSVPEDIQVPPPVLESTNPNGIAAAGSSLQPTLSRDGEQLAFVSDAADLIVASGSSAAKGGDPDRHVFLRDRRDGAIELISVDPQGQPLAGGSTAPAISGDGGAVAFVDAQAQIQVFDSGLGRTRGVVSSTPTGQPGNGTSANPAVPEDGGVVVFDSTATDLEANDGNGAVSDIYHRDLSNGTTMLLSRAADGAPLDGPSRAPAISGDGSVVAFETEARNLPAQPLSEQKAGNGQSQICVTPAGFGGLGRTRGCLSVNPLNGAFGDSDSGAVVLSRDGRFAAFHSTASNLVVGDSNGVSDIFWTEMDTDGVPLGLVRISLSATGMQANGPSSNPAISGDGRYVVFESAASNLTVDGGVNDSHIYLKDVYTGRIARVGTGIGGAQADGDSFDAAISPDGSVLAFTTLASNLANNDQNGLADVYSAASPLADPGVINYSYTYWNPSEAGWGFNVLHQGSLLYATWYTYADDGQTLFLTVEAIATAERSFAGPVYRISGTPFELINGNQAFTAVTQVGEATLSFDPQGQLQLNYTVNGVSQSKLLQRFVFDPAAPNCSGSTISRRNAGNYSDLWWNPSEAGWGLTIAHQGDLIFALWYTYGAEGRDQWISASTMTRQPDGSFAGALQQPFSGIPLTQINAFATSFPVPEIGSARLSFSDGETGSFSYVVGAISQTKPIRRFVVVGLDQPKPLCLAP